MRVIPQLDTVSLIFEKRDGSAEKRTASKLKKILKSEIQHAYVELFILKVCTSELIGEVFLDLGLASHVIYIEKGEKVLCDVANEFTSKFHESSFEGLTICEAFKKA